jgi:hypothetical protein
MVEVGMVAEVDIVEATLEVDTAADILWEGTLEPIMGILVHIITMDITITTTAEAVLDMVIQDLASVSDRRLDIRMDTPIR